MDGNTLKTRGLFPSTFFMPKNQPLPTMNQLIKYLQDYILATDA